MQIVMRYDIARIITATGNITMYIMELVYQTVVLNI